MNKHGLTLAEVIIAALILVVALGGVLYIFSVERAVVARTGRRLQTMDLVRQTLEILKNEVRPTWDDAGEPLEETDPGWTGTWTAWDTALPGDFSSGGKFAGLGRRYRVRNVDASNAIDSDGNGTFTDDVDYKQVEVAVDWSEPTE